MSSNKKSDHYTIISYILLFFSFSILGYIWEVILHLINYGELVNRGTLYGPWLPIYGWGGLIAIILFRKIKNKPILLFFLCVIVCGIIEYGTSIFLEHIYHVRYWDYTGWFLNLNGRICLSGLLCFGIGCCAAIYYIGPYLNHYFQKINIKILLVVCVLLMSLFIFDNIYTNCYPRIGKGITTSIKKD